MLGSFTSMGYSDETENEERKNTDIVYCLAFL